MTRTIATAPGKVMLAGEYAVLDGSRAIVAAVDRRAVAIVDDTGTGDAVVAPARGEGRPAWLDSPFLRAAREVMTGHRRDGAIAHAFDRLTVDTSALHDGRRKLGLGSSAAATVAAIAAVHAHVDPGHQDDRDELVGRVADWARHAHSLAQGGKGAPGSGADIAAATWGNVIDYRMKVAGGGTMISWTSLRPDLVLAFAWTGQPADTATLVAAVQRARLTPAAAAIDRALAQIAAAADALAAPPTTEAAIAAIAAGGRAMTALAAATGVPLVPPAVDALAAALAPLGAAAKTTGAGGGDIVLVAAPATLDRTKLDEAIVAAGLQPLALAVDPRGVDIRRDDA